MIQIKDKADCCGCTACISACSHSAITMQPDTEGFLYPIIDINRCVECGLCETVCPIIHRRLVDKHKPNQKALFAVRHKDGEILMNSSSGGAFLAVAELIIKKGGVVCGVEYSPTMEVRHAFAETLNGCKRFMGSKYVQSNLNHIYLKIKYYLKNDKYVLFVGTPCQVEGLKLFLKRGYDKLITVDLICHAVPSPLIFKEYVNFINKKMKSRLNGLNMRYKKVDGWSRKYSYQYTFSNGKVVCNPSNISNWGRLYFSRLIDRPSCHSCRFTNFNRSGDLTIADFWDDRHKRSDLFSKKGTSLFLVNTQKGMDLFQQLGDLLYSWEITTEEAWQPCLENATCVSPLRDVFWEEYRKKGFDYVYKKYFVISNFNKIKSIVKRMLKYKKKA